MSISTNYDDYYWYSQYNQNISTLGQQINQTKSGQDSEEDNLKVEGTDGSAIANHIPKSPLESLVSDGTITSEQEQAIKDAFEASRMVYQTQAGATNASNQFTNPLENLVKSGVITEGQEAAVKSTLSSSAKAQRMPPPPPPPKEDDENSIKSILESLVSDGTITSDQQDSILSAFKSVLESGKASEQTQTDEQSDSLSSLIESGTITSDQASAIETALSSVQKTQRMPPPPPKEDDENSIKSILESLVSDGTITSDQQDSILSAFKSASESSQANEQSDLLNDSAESGLSANTRRVIQLVFGAAIKAYQQQELSFEDEFTV
jgi:competence protein ComGC